MSERRTIWYHLLSFLKLLILMIIVSTELASSSSTRQCPSECGGVQLKFPFGIGKGCYLSNYYQIECRSTNASRKGGGGVPFLSLIEKEVVDIYHPERYSTYNEYEKVEMSSPFTQHGLVRVKNPIAHAGGGCYVDGILDRAETIMNLTASPFFVDSTNNLDAVGCNSKVSLTLLSQSTTGCELNCYQESKPNIPFYSKRDCSRNVLSNAYVNVYRDNKQRDCRSSGCCQVNLPHEPQQVIGIKIERNDHGINKKYCSVAYLTDDRSTMSSEAKQKELVATGYTTITLGWVIQTRNRSFLDSLACKLKKDCDNATYTAPRKISCICQKSTISEVSYANCVCNRGYRGNPYVSNGCKDVDECKTNPEICGKGKICVNKLGDYDCVVDNKKAIVIGVGAGFGVLVLISGLWWLRKYLIRRRITKRKKNFFERNGGLLLHQELHTRDNNKVENIKIFSSRELEQATENFDQNRVIGKGGQGMVYKGMLADGATVAVKKATVIDADRVQEFINEVVILTQVNHRHVVKILGCCLETEVPILVYEYISNGSLFKHIHDDDEEYSSDQDYAMNWRVRLRIAVETAEALSYLHCSASSPVFHRDIKSTNILIDEKFRSKVADFGTSRSVNIDQTHCTTIVSGTLGYVDPEYYRTSHYTAKSDVYSFGVVLAELITGEKPILTIEDTGQTISLVDHFKMAVKEGRVLDIIDTRVRRSDCNPEQVIAVANLTFNCLISIGDQRPTMRAVLLELEKIYSNVASSSSV